MSRRNLENPDEVELDLETAAGTRINNVQNWNQFSSEDNRSHESQYRAMYAQNKERTTGCSDVYNCHGLIFASRRTKIWQAQTVREILRDDAYKRINASAILPGDVILYVHSTGDITHSGIVVDANTPMPDVPLVVSKWGRWAEIIHYANNCPYAQELDVAWEYYRVQR